MNRAFALVAAAGLLAGGCGKKGPPLPPLVLLPAAPADFTASRRGDEVELAFTVPTANTDGTRPANVERVDVIRFTGPDSVSDREILRLGTTVASVAVRAPVDPELATEPDEPADEPVLTAEGLDQGATVRLHVPLAPGEASAPDMPPEEGSAARGPDEPEVSRPLTGPPPGVPSTAYVGVAVSPRGRRGPLTGRARVPLVPPPAPPPTPDVVYDETAVHVTWRPSPSAAPVQAAPAADEGLLPGRFVGFDAPSIAYYVYDVSPPDPADADATGGLPVRLTTEPVEGRAYDDTRMTWGATRCYTVRTVERYGNLSQESDAPPPVCRTLEDTFPPAPPQGLRPVATSGAISLIWDPNQEADLDGYLVLRGPVPGDTLEPLTPEPIRETTFSDTVPSGERFVYAVVAVDTAGNRSGFSNRVEEAAR